MADYSSYLSALGGGGKGVAPLSSSATSGVSFGASNTQLFVLVGGGLAALLIVVLLLKK